MCLSVRVFECVSECVSDIIGNCVLVCTSSMTLNEPKTHHQTPMTCTYGYTVHIVYVQVIVLGDEFLSLKVTVDVSADQSSSSTLTESSFLFDPCLIHRDTVMLG